MSGQNSDSDFLVPAWNFANNIAAIANYPKVIFFSNWNVLQVWKNMLFGSKLKQKWIQGQISESVQCKIMKFSTVEISMYGN